ncbi:hypothetical protein Zmor_005703 [Zophobas morio]|uniref:Uncharacterized protein n=1 Tax=Zophobas morio TaxID=2755281 RepID=A0AA38INT9_9CUCU|nr:hypothetical protein Zmor_005703 [Zophobas morio]
MASNANSPAPLSSTELEKLTWMEDIAAVLLQRLTEIEVLQASQPQNRSPSDSRPETSSHKLEIPPLITEDTPADFEELTVIVFESEALCHNMLQRLETNTKNMCETKEILKETSEQISNMKTSSNVTNQRENSNRRYAAKTTDKQILRN